MKAMLSTIIKFGFVLVLFTANISAQKGYKLIENLEGNWNFEIGDEKNWANPNFDDSDWDKIWVPSPWEDEGYNGYDGYAWYRKQFNLDSGFKDEQLYLSLGMIDDVAEIYINGMRIGISGSFPPKYITAYNSEIWLPIPKNIFSNKNSNIISIKVYDELGPGGIVNGNIGIYMSEPPLDLMVNLEGTWKFITGDKSEWSQINIDETEWKEITVPSLWDLHGYKDYDGYAWYRITFNIDLDQKKYDEDLVLMMGKIDDLDETFLNGKFVGSTGDLIITPLDGSINGINNKDFGKFRGYKITREDLNDGTNVIAVRVYDGIYGGGIYEGPIGIASLEDYIDFRTENIHDSFF